MLDNKNYDYGQPNSQVFLVHNLSERKCDLFQWSFTFGFISAKLF